MQTALLKQVVCAQSELKACRLENTNESSATNSINLMGTVSETSTGRPFFKIGVHKIRGSWLCDGFSLSESRRRFFRLDHKWLVDNSFVSGCCGRF